MLTEPGLHVDSNADRTTTVRLSGDIGADVLPSVRQAYECAAGSGPLIVDLTEVSFLDSAAVELLFEVARERGLELILGPGCRVFSVMQVSGIGEVATIRSSR
jgi:anti-anti-sigma factor